MRITTDNTAKRGLRGAVGLVHVATPTSTRRVARVNRFNLNAVLAGDVLHFGEQRREGPSVHDQSLLFGAFDPCADAFQVFNRNRPGINFQGFVSDLVRHIPEQPINAALLFARQPFQKPSLIAALVPCGLKIAALFESALSNVLDNSAVESFTSINRGNANDARINADHTFALRIGNVPCDDTSNSASDIWPRLARSAGIRAWICTARRTTDC